MERKRIAVFITYIAYKISLWPPFFLPSPTPPRFTAQSIKMLPEWWPRDPSSDDVIPLLGTLQCLPTSLRVKVRTASQPPSAPFRLPLRPHLLLPTPHTHSIPPAPGSPLTAPTLGLSPNHSNLSTSWLQCPLSLSI